MIKQTDRKVNRLKRHKRVRVHVSGTKERPRLAVFRSLNHVYAQLIDDDGSRTLAAASTVGLKSKGNGMAEAIEVGKAIAAKAKAAGVSNVVFDRGGFLYHGRIKALADAAREAGLEFKWAADIHTRAASGLISPIASCESTAYPRWSRAAASSRSAR